MENNFKFYFLWLISSMVLLTNFPNGECAQILAIFPFTGKSHFIMFEKVVMELVKNGHEVDVYGHFPLEKPVKRYNDHSLVGTLPIISGSISITEIRSWANLFKILNIITERYGTDLCKAMFESKQINDLKKSNKKYDLLITEMFSTDCMLGFAHHFKIPSVLLESCSHYPWTAEYVGLPDNPSYIPNYHTSFSPKMAFYERLINTVILWIAKFHYKYYSLEPSTIMARNFFGSDLPHLDILLRNVSLTLVNSHFSINHARPRPPNVVEVGGIHIEEPQPLDSHYSKIVEHLDSNQKGIIYFTMGTLIQADTLSDETLRNIFKTFEKLPYRILVKADREKLSKNLTLPKNIYFESWMPQIDILCHPNVKLYISHGGNAGVEESVYCGVPILGIPMCGDQQLNIAQVIYLGMATKLDFENINEKNIYESLHEMLTNPKYQEAAKKVQQNFRDRPMSPKDTARYWIEYVLEHQGAPELKSSSIELRWYQYYLLDVILVLVSIPALVFVASVLGLRFACSKNVREKFENKTKTQ